MTNISAVMITLNEGKAIERTLQALQWCDEIIVIDSGSTDQTQEICERYGCTFIYRPFDGYGTQKHFAVAQASHDWVLSIDADEVVTPELQQEIVSLFASRSPDEKGFRVPISLVFMGKLLRFGDVYKIPHLRLFNKKHGQFNSNTVHEGIVLQGKVGNLRQHMLHYSYESTSDYFTKFNAYTTAGANELFKRRKQSGKLQVWTRLPLTFFKGFFLKGGILDGYPGFVWALFSAFYPVVKYIKLNELYKKNGQPFTKGLPILMYHKISDGQADSLTVPAETLEKHLQHLQQQGYQSISVKELLAFIDNKQPLPPKPVLLTFDDAYLNNLTWAYPLLQKYHTKAVIFLPTAYIGNTNEWDGGGEPLMSYPQLKSIAGNLIEFGLHSHTHQNYKHLSAAQIAEDVQMCQKALTDNELSYVAALAYPYGGRPKKQAILNEMRQIFKQDGVRLAFRIGNKSNPFSFKSPYEIKRIDIRGTDSFREFTLKLKK